MNDETRPQSLADSVSKELLKAEYDSLNKEILDNSSKIYIVLNVCISTSGALLAWSLTRDPKDILFGLRSWPLFSLFPFVVILPSMLLVRSSLSSSVRIAGYLKIAYEDRMPDSVQWQTNMQKWRKKDEKRQKKEDPLRQMMRGLSATFTTLATVCFVISVLSATIVVWPLGTTLNAAKHSAFYAATELLAVVVFRRVLRQVSAVWSHDNFCKCQQTWEEILKEAPSQNGEPSCPPDRPARS
jgi:hypothetical protein